MTHDLILGAVFVAMLIGPAIVAARAGGKS